MKIVKSVGSPTYPIFQKVLETAKGGFTLKTTGLTKGKILKAGTPLAIDEATRLAAKAKVDGSDVSGLLYEDVLIEDNTTVDVVLRGTVYDNRIEDVPDAVKAALPLIVFSKSY